MWRWLLVVINATIESELQIMTKENQQRTHARDDKTS